jgi:hypothetical protein
VCTSPGDVASVTITWSSTSVTAVTVTYSTASESVAPTALEPSGSKDFPYTCGSPTVYRFSASNSGGSANTTVNVTV